MKESNPYKRLYSATIKCNIITNSMDDTCVI